MGGGEGKPPWGSSRNYWAWVDRRSVILHGCPSCGAEKGEQCVRMTGTKVGARAHPPHSSRRLPVEAEAREWRLGIRD